MDPDTDVCQTEQPQISYSVDFIAEQSSAIGSLNLLGREGRTQVEWNWKRIVMLPGFIARITAAGETHKNIW